MKIYDRIEDICDLIKLFCLSIVISLILFIYYKLPYDIKIAYVFLTYIVVSYLINSLIHHLTLFILLHVMLFFPPFFIGLSDWGTVSCILFLVVITILDFSLWFSKHDRKTWSIPLSCLTIFVGIYLYSNGMERDIFANAVYYLGQFFVIASLAEMYLNNMHFLPTEGNDSLQKPKKSVLTRNNTYIVSFLFVILAFNCITNLSIIEKLLSFLLSKIGRCIQFLLSLLFQTDEVSVEVDTPEDTMVPLPMPGRPSLIANILSYLFMIAGICFILYVMYKAIAYIFKMIKKHLHHKFKESIALDDDMVEVSEDLNAKKKPHKPLFRFNMDVRDRIRKRYQQEIKHQIKRGYQNRDSYTPNERSTQLLENEQADIQALTSCYNKVRYSDHPITAKEWNHIK